MATSPGTSTPSDASSELVGRVTAPRDGSRWTRPQTSIDTPTGDDDAPGDWARGLGVVVLWALAVVGAFVLLAEGHDAVVQPLAGGTAAEPVAVVSVLVTAAIAGWAWVLAQRYGYRSRPPAFRFAVGTAIVGGAFCFLLIIRCRPSACRAGMSRGR